MGRRALLTDRERELIADTDATDHRYVAISRVRKRVQNELPEDVELLKENHPELFAEVREVVCDDRDE